LCIENFPRLLELIREERPSNLQPDLKALYFASATSHIDKIDKPTRSEIINVYKDCLTGVNQSLNVQEWVALVNDLFSHMYLEQNQGQLFQSEHSYLPFLQEVTPLIKKEYERRLDLENNKLHRLNIEVRNARIAFNNSEDKLYQLAANYGATFQDLKIHKEKYRILFIKIRKAVEMDLNITSMELEKSVLMIQLENRIHTSKTLTMLNQLASKTRSNTFLMHENKKGNKSNYWLFILFGYLLASMSFIKKLAKILPSIWFFFFKSDRSQSQPEQQTQQATPTPKVTQESSTEAIRPPIPTPANLQSLTPGLSVGISL